MYVNVQVSHDKPRGCDTALGLRESSQSPCMMIIVGCMLELLHLGDGCTAYLLVYQNMKYDNVDVRMLIVREMEIVDGGKNDDEQSSSLYTRGRCCCLLATTV
jgi:hypothetical protein